jgi:hypothetical protein
VQKQADQSKLSSQLNSNPFAHSCLDICHLRHNKANNEAEEITFSE